MHGYPLNSFLFLLGFLHIIIYNFCSIKNILSTPYHLLYFLKFYKFFFDPKIFIVINPWREAYK